jgi:hypothetical protein
VRCLVAALVLFLPAAAAAEEAERFFVEQKADGDETAIDGSLTSTTFFYREAGLLAPAPVGGVIGARTASPVGRLFTDLRGQLDARHIKGGTLDVKADFRARYSQPQQNPDRTAGAAYLDDDPLPTQSGRLGDNELELRELYVKRDGSEYDIYVGRKFSLELAAVKFDGIEIQRRASASWTYLGFAGLYPTRGSRDLADDYPKVSVDPSNPAETDTKRILPITGGLGGAYRYERFYGSVGAVGIMPLARDQSGQIETPRVFATASGYWRRSQRLDIYHYLVLDAMGASGAGLTNLTLGVGFQPRQTVRFTAQATRVDTETLNVQVLNQLEDPDQNGNQLQNNIEVQRVAQESARVGLSVGLRQNRFEVSTHATVRRRPELAIETPDGATTVVFPTAQAADIYLGLVDRRSWKDLRLGASVVSTFGVGSANLNRSKSTVARVDARREMLDGKAEVEADVRFISAADDNRGTLCNPADLETCYGASRVTSIAVGGVGYYRFKPQWFAIVAANIGRLSQTVQYTADAAVDLPAITTATLFLRLAYRF